MPGQTEEGYAYWYNTLTGESSWEAPPEVQQAQQAQEEQPAAVAEEAVASEAAAADEWGGGDEFGLSAPEPPPPEEVAAEVPAPTEAPAPAEEAVEAAGAATAVEAEAVAEVPPPAAAEEVPAPAKRSAAAADAAADGAAAAEASPWVPGQTEEGYAYWYNTLTGESSWEAPPEVQQAQQEAPPEQPEPEPEQPAEPEPQQPPPPEEAAVAEAATEAAAVVAEPAPPVPQAPAPAARVSVASEAAVAARAMVASYKDPQEQAMYESLAALDGTAPPDALRAFPGPVDASTPKDVLLKFTREREAEGGGGADAANQKMLWRLLHLLCKHDGTLDGSGGDDAATELLDTLLAFADDLKAKEPAPPFSVAAPGFPSPLAPPAQSAEAAAAAATTLEDLLLRGRREEALDHAVGAGMWADALLLSSHMDADAWRRVMSTFAQGALAAGSPLRTLYSQFAGDAPAADDVATASWPRQLAMMLANPTAGDTEAMRRVGDAMLSRDGAGVVAAHCCYLLSEQPLDAAPPAEAGPPRMLVVGHDAAAGAPPTWALQATEIYAAHRSRDPNPPALSALPPYQLLYAYRLADADLLEQAAKYVDVAARAGRRRRRCRRRRHRPSRQRRRLRRGVWRAPRGAAAGARRARLWERRRRRRAAARRLARRRAAAHVCRRCAAGGVCRASRQ